jgi:hypothetical protein
MSAYLVTGIVSAVGLALAGLYLANEDDRERFDGLATALLAGAAGIFALGFVFAGPFEVAGLVMFGGGLVLVLLRTLLRYSPGLAAGLLGGLALVLAGSAGYGAYLSASDSGDQADVAGLTFLAPTATPPAVPIVASGFILSGRIEDTEGRPIAGANARATGPVFVRNVPALRYETFSQEDGSFRIELTRPGGYNLYVSAAGFEPVFLVAFQDLTELTGDLELPPITLKRYEEMVAGAREDPSTFVVKRGVTEDQVAAILMTHGIIASADEIESIESAAMDGPGWTTYLRDGRGVTVREVEYDDEPSWRVVLREGRADGLREIHVQKVCGNVAAPPGVPIPQPVPAAPPGSLASATVVVTTNPALATTAPEPAPPLEGGGNASREGQSVSVPPASPASGGGGVEGSNAPPPSSGESGTLPAPPSPPSSSGEGAPSPPVVPPAAVPSGSSPPPQPAGPAPDPTSPPESPLPPPASEPDPPPGIEVPLPAPLPTVEVPLPVPLPTETAPLPVPTVVDLPLPAPLPTVQVPLPLPTSVPPLPTSVPLPPLVPGPLLP